MDKILACLAIVTIAGLCFAHQEYHITVNKHRENKSMNEPTIVKSGAYTIVQTGNNHINVYRDERMIFHATCKVKKTEKELIDMLKMFEGER